MRAGAQAEPTPQALGRRTITLKSEDRVALLSMCGGGRTFAGVDSIVSQVFGPRLCAGWLIRVPGALSVTARSVRCV